MEMQIYPVSFADQKQEFLKILNLLNQILYIFITVSFNSHGMKQHQEEEKMKTKRIISAFLALMFVLCVMPAGISATAYALEDGIQAEAATSEAGLCEHHTAHDEECGYKAAAAESPCTHQHKDECYITETNCIHVHGDDCGYAEEIPANPCIYENAGVCTCGAEPAHSESCGYAPAVPGAECTHIHDELCGYSEGIPCCHTHDEACGYAEGFEEIPCDCGMPVEHGAGCGMNMTAPEGHVHDEDCGYREAQAGQSCAHECTEESGCITKALRCQHAHDESCGYAEAAEGAECGYECGECGAEIFSDTGVLYGDDDVFNNDEIFDRYVENLFYDNDFSVYGTQGRNRLSAEEKNIYDFLKSQIEAVAAGTLSSTQFTMTSLINTSAADQAALRTEVQSMVRNTWNALLHDCPYDFYWHDKTGNADLNLGGVSYSWSYNNSYNVTRLQISFLVADNYSAADYYTVDSSAVLTAVSAASTAKSVIGNNAGKSDYNKLVAYKDYICNAVTYDEDAADSGEFSVDNDPWQLVHAFDGNPNTNIVCEGYSKAFQYLCDNSDFINEVNCYSVSGDAGGPHMWNIVNINGTSYHTDITWIDSGFSSFFLTGYDSGSITNGYYYRQDSWNDGTYYYDDETKNLWGTGSDSILNISSTDFDPNTVAATRLATPVVSVSNDASTGKPRLSWNAVSGADRYWVGRSTGANGTYTYTTSYSTSYVDTNAVAGNTYYYRVCAVHPSNSSYNSAYSAVVSKTYDTGAGKLATPVVSIALNASGKPQLSWKAVSGADRYWVGRSTSANGTYSFVTTTSTGYTDTNAVVGTTYYYRVCAVHPSNSGYNSAYSAVVSKTCTAPSGKLATPVVSLTSNAATGKPQLSWKAVSGADRYWVGRSTSKNGTYTYAATTSTSYTDTKAVAGTTYYYRVCAVHPSNSDYNSAYSAVAWRVCDLARPTLSITNNAASGKPQLSWNAVSGANRYWVGRSTSKNGTYTFVTTTSTSYVDTNAAAGTTYYYQVCAVHPSNSSANSAYSPIAWRVCDLARPVVTTWLDPDTGKPCLYWDPIPGADRYWIGISTSANGTYEYTTITFNDPIHTGAVSGKTYYYRVCAVHPSNSSANSAYSTVVSITSR